MAFNRQHVAAGLDPLGGALERVSLELFRLVRSDLLGRLCAAFAHVDASELVTVDVRNEGVIKVDCQLE